MSHRNIAEALATLLNVAVLLHARMVGCRLTSLHCYSVLSEDVHFRGLKQRIIITSADEVGEVMFSVEFVCVCVCLFVC